MEKRVRATEGPNFKPPSVVKCTHNLTTSTKCGEVCVPMSKFCMKHILEDDKQVSFVQMTWKEVNATLYLSLKTRRIFFQRKCNFFV